MAEGELIRKTILELANKVAKDNFMLFPDFDEDVCQDNSIDIDGNELYDFMCRNSVEELVELPNTLHDWAETHFQVVQFITDNPDARLIKTICKAHGEGGLMELAVTLADLFQNGFNGAQWDGQWYDVLDAFFEDVAPLGTLRGYDIEVFKKHQAWLLTNDSDNNAVIAKNDEFNYVCQVFEDDAQAYDFVKECAESGCRECKKAIDLVGKPYC